MLEGSSRTTAARPSATSEVAGYANTIDPAAAAEAGADNVLTNAAAAAAGSVGISSAGG